ncbi:hypothetical protein QFW77_13345 [Luteimonas sp. RD2P54]|uniref:Type II secretion system protein n=1 Tax=Luteimonas endophytica TaxID=3042023 RepID=A0ABT6JCN5_9GAMM|nr:hypothetical protein [Luteimonas endophytica]MDH5823963.1 hypothetical protein [Luteimonas endophytica]
MSVFDGRALAIAATAAVAATVIAAILAMGGPAAQREAKLDVRRIDDLQRIAQLLDSHVRHQGALPADLQVLAARPGTRLALTDPAGARYQYQPTGGRGYRLCAEFATDTASTPEAWRGEEWSHGAGRQCFERTAAAAPDGTQ